MDNQQQVKVKTPFTPLQFLSALGAGGTSVAFFAFFQYLVFSGKGLVSMNYVHSSAIFAAHPIFIIFMEFGMALFALLHVVLLIQLIVKLIPWFRAGAYKEMLQNPLANSALVTPIIAMAMTMNVFLASVRYFFAVAVDNLQAMMLPGLIAWIVIWVVLMVVEIKLLKISFVKGFDVNKIHFGWLLHPFAIVMVTVTGSGIAAMAQSKGIADTAFFLLLISGSMGLFLLLVKVVSIFKSHFSADGLPDKQFLPSFLIVVPNVTLYAITFFRIGHYLEHHYGAHLQNYFMMIVVVALAFETWYMAFGLVMLKDYFKKYFHEEFHVSQWGLVCPFVAYSVLSAFVYKEFVQNAFFYVLPLIVLAFTVTLFFVLLYKQMLCKKNKQINIKCE